MAKPGIKQPGKYRHHADRPATASERVARWRERHPEKYKAYVKTVHKNRKARRRNAPGRATTAQLAARWAYYGGRCWMCGGIADTWDHVKALANGGSNWPANHRPACGSCNSIKGDR